MSQKLCVWGLVLDFFFFLAPKANFRCRGRQRKERSMFASALETETFRSLAARWKHNGK